MESKEKEKRIIDSTSVFKMAIYSFSVIMLLVIISVSFFVVSVKNLQKSNQVSIEKAITNLEIKSNDDSYILSIKNDAKNYVRDITDEKYRDFLIKYNENQTNWLNGWLTGLTILLAFIGLVAPLCFMKLYDDKKKQMDDIIKEAKREKEKSKSNVKKMERQLKIVDKRAKQTSEDLDKIKSYLSEITSQSEKITRDVIEVKEYVNKAKALSKYNEGLNKIREDEKDETKQNEALQCYIDAHNLDPENSKYLYAIGNLYSYMRKNDFAIQYLIKAIEKQEDVTYYYDLLLVYFNKKDYENSINISSKIINSKDSNNVLKAKTYSILAIIYSDKKENEKCITSIEESLNQGYESYILYCNIGLAYINIGNHKKAIEILEKNNQKYPRYRDYYNLAEAYIFTQDFEKALNLLQTGRADKNSEFTYLFKDDYEKWNNELDKAEPSETIDNIKQILNNLELRSREDD